MSDSNPFVEFLALTPQDFGIGRLFDIIHEAIIVGDSRTGEIVLWNPAATEIFGYSSEEAAQMNLVDLVPEELKASHLHGLERFSRTGHGPLIDTHQVVELPAIRKDGTRITIELSLSSLQPLTSDQHYALAVIRDVTGRKEADRLKTAILSSVSHEVRTSLAIVLGFGVTLQRAAEGKRMSEDKQREVIDRLVFSAQKLSNLVNDLLDVDRLHRGVLDVVRATTDIPDLVMSVVEGMNLEGRQVHIDVSPGRGHVDAAKVERIIEHLIYNALKHSRSSSPIDVQVKMIYRELWITVEDRGDGVPDDQKSSIFEAFHRLDLDDPNPGAGIGLSVVKQFAEAHGGKAWVEDRPGGGSSFKVRLHAGRI